MAKIRWGVLGTSAHYRKRIHIPLSRLKTAELAGIASRDARKAADAAAKLGFAKGFGSYEELLDDPDIDCVYIPLPNHMHLEWIKKAADKGKHVLCEKPLCMSAAETGEAFSYCASKGVFLMEAFMFRFHPQWIRVKEVIDSGEIGRIVSINTVFSYDNRNPDDIRNRMPGGGALRDIGCYGIAVSNFLLDAEPDDIISVLDTDPVFGIDRLTSFIMDYGDCHSSVTVSTQMFPSQRVVITAVSGSIEVKIPFNAFTDVPAELRIITKIGERTVLLPIEDQYANEFASFGKAVKNSDESFFREMEIFSKRNQNAIDNVSGQRR